MTDDLEWCRAFIDHNCIYRSPPGELIITSPDYSTNAWQFYMPIAVLDQEFAERVANLFWDRYRTVWLDTHFQLCGCESGGSLLVSALQDAHVNAFMIKKAAKSYGLQNWLEGVVDPDLPVLLVDDVVGSGKTMRAQYHRLESFGLKVMGCWAIASCKGAPILGGKHNFEALFKPSDFARLHPEYTRKYGKEPQFLGTVI